MSEKLPMAIDYKHNFYGSALFVTCVYNMKFEF